jgi:lipopolysaccharide export system permease protein
MPTRGSSLGFRLGLRGPWTIYRYLLWEAGRPFFGAATFFLFVLLMFQVIRLSDVFIVHNVSGFTILSLMSYLGLTFTPVIIPISFLLAVLLGFGRLSTDSEILAMRASGISIYQLLKPIMIAGVFLSLITLFCNFYFVPYGAKMFRYELFRIYNTKAIATIHPGTFTEGFFDLVLYADEVDSRRNTLSKVLLYDERNKGSPITIVARSGRIVSNVQDELGTPGLVLRLMNGNIHRSDPAQQIYEKTDFSTYDIFLKIETAKVVGVDVPKTMDIDVLHTRLKEVKALLNSGKPLEALEERDRLDYINYGVEYWKRFALSFSCLIFAVLGVAFGVVRTRTVSSNSFLICLVVLLGYWGVYSLGHNWASDGKIPAFWGMWAPNFMLSALALWSLRRMARG